MIKFFRKIRQRLLTENKFSKYLLYAIGEITLVVIGILIAVSINNWNEKRISNVKFKNQLALVREELAYNIKKSNEELADYRQRQSSAIKVLNQHVDYDDYQTDRSLIHLLNWGGLVELSDNAFKTLISTEGQDSSHIESMVKQLNSLYLGPKERIDLLQEAASDHRIEVDKILKTKKWYSKFYTTKRTEKFPDEMMAYFLTDPYYLNEVSYFLENTILDYCGWLIDFRNQASIIYQNLSNYLNLEMDSAIVSNVKNYKHYIGTYKSDNGDQIEFKLEKEYMTFQIQHKNDSVLYAYEAFIPYSKTEFEVRSRYMHFNLNENEEVKELVRFIGINKRIYTKIK